MIIRILIFFVLSLLSAYSADKGIELPDSRVRLSTSDGWSIKDKKGEIGIYPSEQSPDQPSIRIHFARIQTDATSLQEAIDKEIDRVTEHSPKWGSSCDRRSYKGSIAVRTVSGMEGLRANFWYDHPTGRRYVILKYYFFDEHGKIFKVCSHIEGDQKRFEQFESAILKGLFIEGDG